MKTRQNEANECITMSHVQNFETQQQARSINTWKTVTTSKLRSWPKKLN